MCHADQHWTEALPLVLLSIRSSFKADLHASSAELVYGETLGIPGELLTQTAHPVQPAHLKHSCTKTSIPTHVFLRQDATRLALEPPYSGSYQVISRKEKILRLFVRGKPITVPTDRVKPAYNTSNPAAKTTPTISPPTTPPATSSPHPSTRTTHSGRHVHFPTRFNT
jgi:hypothetical protein